MLKQTLAYSPPYGVNYLKDIETIAFMGKCGINVMKLILSNSFSRLGVPYSPYPPIWRGPYDYDLSVIDRQVADAVAQNPDIEFIVMLDLNSPPFLRMNPELDSFNNLVECYLNEQWMSLVKAFQETLLRYLEKSFSERIVAYYIAGGRTQEWFDYGLDEIRPLRSRRYPRWCEENKRRLMELPQPGDSDVTPVPPRLAQWREYGSALVRECCSFFFQRTREFIRPGIPIGGVFGNIHDFGALSHLDAEQFYKTVHPDYYIGPSCNSKIAMGGASGFQSAQLMLKRYGAGYLHSCDRLLSTSSKEIGPGIMLPESPILNRQHSVPEDIACLKREFAIALVHGFSLWFFNIWGFAYSGQEVRRLFMEFGPLWRKYAGLSSGTDAETLLVFDPDSDCRIGNDGAWGNAMLRREILPEAGITFTTAAFSDLESCDLSPYRMIIFQYLYGPEAKKLKVIQERACSQGRTVIGLPGDSCHNQWTSEELRKAGIIAKIHFFTDDSDVKVWSSPEFLFAHSEFGGRKHFRLKRRAAKITEIFSGNIIAVDTDEFDDDFAKPDTRLYYLV